MLAERTAQGHQAVAGQNGSSHRTGRGGRCHGVAGDALWQRHKLTAVGLALEAVVAMPVPVQQIAMSQIGDACAAQPDELGKGRGVAGCA